MPSRRISGRLSTAYIDASSPADMGRHRPTSQLTLILPHRFIISSDGVTLSMPADVLSPTADDMRAPHYRRRRRNSAINIHFYFIIRRLIEAIGGSQPSPANASSKSAIIDDERYRRMPTSTRKIAVAPQRSTLSPALGTGCLSSTLIAGRQFQFRQRQCSSPSDIIIIMICRPRQICRRLKHR